MQVPHRDQFSIDIMPWLLTDRRAIKRHLNDRDARIALMRLGYAGRGVMADSERSAWFCLCVDVDREKDVEKRLAEFDIETYVAKAADYQFSKRGQLKTVVGKVLLPGYVLVRCGVDTRAFLGLEAVEGVHEMLGGAARPHPISDDNLNLFKAFVDSGAAADVDAPMLGVGDEVFVRRGPWMDWRGTVVSVQEGRSAVIDVAAFGRSTEITMPLDYFEKL